MGKVLLLLVTLPISSTNDDILSSQGPHTYKHISFVSSVRKKHTLKIVINQYKIMFSSTLNSAYNEVTFNEKSAITKENLCTKYTPFTYKYIILNEKLPITKQNLCIFFFVIDRVECILSVYYHGTHYCRVLYSITNLRDIDISVKGNNNRYIHVLQFSLNNLAPSKINLATTIFI